MENTIDSVESITANGNTCANCTKGTRARNGVMLWGYYTAKGTNLTVDRLRAGGYTHRPGAWHRVCRACASVVSCTEQRFWPTWGEVDDLLKGAPAESDVPSVEKLTTDPVADMNAAMEQVKSAKADMENARLAVQEVEQNLSTLRAKLALATQHYEQGKVAYAKAAKRLADTF